MFPPFFVLSHFSPTESCSTGLPGKPIYLYTVKLITVQYITMMSQITEGHARYKTFIGKTAPALVGFKPLPLKYEPDALEPLFQRKQGYKFCDPTVYSTLPKSKLVNNNAQAQI